MLLPEMQILGLFFWASDTKLLLSEPSLFSKAELLVKRISTENSRFFSCYTILIFDFVCVRKEKLKNAPVSFSTSVLEQLVTGVRLPLKGFL